MDSLASHMGISKRTIYENFKDKDELVMSVMNWMGGKQMDGIMAIERNSETVIHFIFSIIEHVGRTMQEMNPLLFEDLKKYHHSVDRNTIILRVNDNLDISLPVVERGIRDGIFKKGLNADLINRALHSIFMITGDFDYFPREVYSRVDVVRAVFINFLRGIATPRGIELIDKCENEIYIKK